MKDFSLVRSVSARTSHHVKRSEIKTASNQIKAEITKAEINKPKAEKLTR
jgi:hypothetical protein